MREGSHQPIIVQHDFLGQGGRLENNEEVPLRETGNTVPRGRLIMNRITRPNPVNPQMDLCNRLTNRR